jgi:hypothetical protein
LQEPNVPSEPITEVTREMQKQTANFQARCQPR